MRPPQNYGFSFKLVSIVFPKKVKERIPSQLFCIVPFMHPLTSAFVLTSSFITLSLSLYIYIAFFSFRCSSFDQRKDASQQQDKKRQHLKCPLNVSVDQLFKLNFEKTTSSQLYDLSYELFVDTNIQVASNFF